MNYNKELLNRFLTEKVTIALRTQEEWNMFMELLEKETDLTWSTGNKPTELDVWEGYKEETSIINGCYSDGTITFSSCSHHEELGYEIIEFKELIKEKEMNYNKELLNRFLTEKVAIALRTQDEWNELMALLESETDLRWVYGMKPTELVAWDTFKENTQVGIGNGFIFYGINYFIENDYEIIEFKEIVKEREKNLADKLRFLADRWEDGKEFYIDGLKHSFSSGKLVIIPSGIDGEIEINHLEWLNLKLAPQWEFTEDEKVILRNLPEEYTWIARDKDNDLIFFAEKPYKKNNYWGLKSIEIDYLESPFVPHLFQSIQWTDEEPCEFRKYL